MKLAVQLLSGVLLSCGAVTLVNAQVQRSGSDGNVRLTQQLQQLAGERAQLQTENASLKQQVDDLKKQLEKAKTDQVALQQRTKALQASASNQRSAADQEQAVALERTKTQLQELIGKFRETAQSLRDVETDRTQMRTQLAQREREYKTCVDRNVEFYNLNNEILTKLDDRGFWSSLTSAEPFTRIARTRLENLIEDYRYRADELKVREAAGAAGVAKEAAAR